MYRGHQQTKPGHIMGHEFVGTVEELGSDVRNLQKGDRVFCTFSPSCMRCWYCQHGLTNRCTHGTAFGTQALDGGQAEFVRVPFADGTLHHIPNGLDDELLIMCADVFPTGYYGASRAIEAFAPPILVDGTTTPPIGGEFKKQSISEAVFVCLGCGPVGLCAIVTAKAKGVRTLYAVDSVPDRLAEAERIGAIPLMLGQDDIQGIILKATGGRGADAVIEVVGNQAALKSAFDLLRPCGTLSSIGFHQSDLPFTGLDCYVKNLK
jgi:threonine dehydrogenase-like Zn-dependent dehydrogenase